MNGRGIFARGVQAGTYQLDGDELSWNTCGACVTLTADAETNPKCYFVTGGTVVLTSVADRLAGSLDGLTFEHVACSNFDPPIDDGCATSIERLWFDDAFVPWCD
jgi:hypothetical protein